MKQPAPPTPRPYGCGHAGVLAPNEPPGTACPTCRTHGPGADERHQSAVAAVEGALPNRSWLSRRQTASTIVRGLRRAGWELVPPDAPRPSRVVRGMGSTILVFDGGDVPASEALVPCSAMWCDEHVLGPHTHTAAGETIALP